MVDVGAKPESERRAVAEARLRMSPATATAIAAGDGPKGDVLGPARMAGIAAAKRTGDLIPLAHPLPLSFADVGGEVDAGGGLVDADRRGPLRRPYRGRDGGDDRRVGRRADRLRHGEGDRARDRDRARSRCCTRAAARAASGIAVADDAADGRPFRAAALTISTSRAAGEAVDEGGPALADFATSIGCEVEVTEAITDDRDLIAERLRSLADEVGVDLVLTTGGTGLGPSDVTPEATRDVIDREAPGIAEAMRAVSREHTPKWMLSRGVAGARGATLIVNFPGSPRSIEQCGAAIAGALPHALRLLAGERPH